MRRVQQTGTARVAADGTATVFLNGPHRRVHWDVSSVVVASEAVPDADLPKCAVYRGYVSTATLLSESRSADSVTFEGSAGDQLLASEQLIIAITGAQPGTMAVVNMFAIEYE